VRPAPWAKGMEMAEADDLPPHLWVGVVLVVVAWPLAWSRLQPFSEFTFFPLWLGYILTVDGGTRVRRGESLLTRQWRRFALLFVFSVPLWWLFEYANGVLGNWRYVQPRDWGSVADTAVASLAFSTVMPALFVTAELYRTFALVGRPRRWVRITPSRPWLALIAALGLSMFILSMMAPRQAFPLVWLGIFFLLDPINALTGSKSLAEEVADGRWDTLLVLFAAGLTCGFFWEMWNVRSLPKWVYHVPYVDGPKLFEMPWLGYGGYLPFALEVYAAYHLLHGLLFRQRDAYLDFDAAGTDDWIERSGG
jgi:hypothetical protein